VLHNPAVDDTGAGEDATRGGEARDDGAARGASVYDRVRPPVASRRLGALPRLLRDAFAVVWRAAPRELALSAALQLVAGVGAASLLLVGREVLSRVLAADDTGGGIGDVAPGIVLLVVITALMAVAAAIQSERALLLGELVARRAQDDVLEVATAVDLAAFESAAFYDRLERARWNAGARPLMAVNGLVQSLAGLLGTAGVGVALLTIHPVLLPLAVVALVPAGLATAANSRTLHAFSLAMTSGDRERHVLYTTLAGREHAKEVRSFALAGFLRRRHGDLHAARIGALRRVVRTRLGRALLAVLAAAAATALVMAAIVALLLRGDLTVAAAATGAWGVVMLGQRLQALGAGAATLYESALFVEDFTSFRELLPPPAAGAPAAAKARRGFDRLEVDDVTFTYPGSTRPALRGVSLEVRRGEVVAVVGENGSGKTTLATLLAGLHRPTSGSIRRDGIDASGVPDEEIRRDVAVVFQDFARLALSAHENIAVGRIERLGDRDAVEAAAADAGAAQVIEGLPRGYDTILSKLFAGGRDLSVGQWQRIALARAFFRDAPFIIMDEPSAALDPRAEHELFKIMREVSRGRTVLLITHRLSTVRTADRIHVMDAGRIVERGTHDELMTLDGRYAELFRLQATAYAAPSEGELAR